MSGAVADGILAFVIGAMMTAHLLDWLHCSYKRAASDLIDAQQRRIAFLEGIVWADSRMLPAAPTTTCKD